MEIYLKMDPKKKRKSSQSIPTQHMKGSEFSHACGYNFDNSTTTNSFQGEMTSPQNSSQKLQEAQALNLVFEKMQLAYEEHRIDEAFTHREKYLENFRLSPENKQKQLKLLEHHVRLLEKIQQQMNDLRYYESHFKSDGWVHKKQGKNYNLYTKEFPQTVAALAVAEIDVPIEKFLFVVNEVDLMKNIMPFMVHSKQEKAVARNNKIGHVVTDVPILSQRQAFFQGVGYDRLQHNQTIFLYTRSIHDRKDLQERFEYTVNINPDAVQLDYKFVMIEYKPYDRKRGQIRIAMNVDLKLTLPNFILDPLVQNFAKDFLKNILAITNNFEGSEWHKRVQEKPEFSVYIKSIMNRHLPETI